MSKSNEAQNNKITLGHLLALVLVLVAGLWLRLHLVFETHYTAVDGKQYLALANELLRGGRFAFSQGAPLSYSRLPGYPLILALLYRKAALPADVQVVLGTQLNAIFDVATALIVYGIVRDLCRSRAAALAGMVITLVCPLMFILASHTLTETPATFFGTLEIWLTLRALSFCVDVQKGESGKINKWTYVYAALCGLVAGFAQLIRADAATLLPPVAIALVWAGRGANLRRRVALLAVFGACAIAVYAPWPLRNLARFGKPYLAAWQWRTAWDGRPLPTGPIAWARTWARIRPEETSLDPVFAFEQPMHAERRGALLPWMYDDEAERQKLVALFGRYDRERLSPAVDDGFRALATERTARARFRTYVTLPAERFVRTFDTVPPSELSSHTKIFDFPAKRPYVRWFDLALYAFAALGIVFLRRERVAWLLALAIVGRVVLLAYTVPMGLSQRHLAEVFPLLIALAAAGGAAAISAARGSLARARRATPSGSDA